MERETFASGGHTVHTLKTVTKSSATSESNAKRTKVDKSDAISEATGRVFLQNYHFIKLTLYSLFIARLYYQRKVTQC